MHDDQVASEVLFRIQTPNSAPRHIRVIALTDDDTEVANCRAYADVEFVHASEFAALLQGPDASAELDADAFETWLGTPDIVVIAAREGDNASAVAVAAHAYRRRGVTVSVVVNPVVDPVVDPSDGNGHATADSLRPYSTMMVRPTRAGYLQDLLAALGATG
jgi:ABC-type transport system involved in cytochrome c biogenesis permease component